MAVYVDAPDDVKFAKQVYDFLLENIISSAFFPAFTDSTDKAVHVEVVVNEQRRFGFMRDEKFELHEGCFSFRYGG